MSENRDSEHIVLEIPWDRCGTLVQRDNRFMATVSMEPEKTEEKSHVHDPGRLRELLYPGNHVLLRKARSPGRKTSWDIIAAWSENGGGHWVLVHSGYHREIGERVIKDGHISPFKGVRRVESEVKVGKSRLDHRLFIGDADVENGNDEVVFVEIKGCTLAVDSVALFPDAPTTRGTRHMEDLAEIARNGTRAALVVLIFHPHVKCFAPNEKTDARFATAFYNAIDAGVEVHPLVFEYVATGMSPRLCEKTKERKRGTGRVVFRKNVGVYRGAEKF